ncbi:SRPBCC family protein [Streptomyces sp. NPDC054949]|uniref:SRPBCC family protein n=1 Tax=Streptomyces sp. NPDC001553 TaxID=3154385 RepID=UPI00332A97F2
MVFVERSFTIPRPQAVLIDYLKDFGRAREWDPGTKTCERLDDGPVRVGSTWSNVSEFRGRETRLTYQLVRLDEDRLTFVGDNSTVTTTDDLLLTAVPGGTALTYRARLDFKGLFKLAAPFLGKEFNRLADEVERVMPQVLANL